MTTKEVLAALEAQGDEKVRQHNTKWGAGSNQYGVKMGDIRHLAKQIKTGDALARQLWDTGNIEAQLVACLIVKPKALTAADLDGMVRTISFSQVADWFSSYLLKDHPDMEQLRLQWMEDDNKWAARAGWGLTAGRIAKGAEGIDLDKLLDRLEKEMPSAPPETQWTMNTALAYTGIHHPQHRKRALAIGERLGILRDYPVSKGCTSPYAPIWINEMVRRQEQVK